MGRYGYCGRGNARRPRLIFAVFMIVAGILLFLANLGFLPIVRVWDYWPLVFIAIGLGKMGHVNRPSALVVGAMFVVLGVVFTLINVGVFKIRMHDGTWPLSIVFLALGIGGLARVLEGSPRTGRPPDFVPQAPNVDPPAPPWPTSENWLGWSKSGDVDSTPVLDNFTLMGSVQRKVENLNFRGGTLTCVLGSIEIDLRRASMPEGKNTAHIETNAVLGSIKLRVPEAWRVIWNGVNVMGAFEDKTIPPKTGAEAPQLILTGLAVMGAIEAEG